MGRHTILIPRDRELVRNWRGEGCFYAGPPGGCSREQNSKPTVAGSSNSWLPAGVPISKRRHQSNAVCIGYISVLVDPLSRNS